MNRSSPVSAPPFTAQAQSGLRFVFGPVPSRRLGRSLGVDTVPSKTCNWNCVYCQLGRTHPLTNTRKTHVPAVLKVSSGETAPWAVLSATRNS